MTKGSDKLMGYMKLREHVNALASFDRALAVIDAATPGRTSTAQAHTFLQIVLANAKGRDVTMTEIREEGGIGHHMNRSYQMFLPARDNDKDRENLGWIRKEESETDGRLKFLRLTDEGAAIALKIAEALA